MPSRKWGLTVALDSIPLHEHERVFREAEDLGYTDFWSMESDVEPYVPLALGAAWTKQATLGTAIVGAYSRGPAVIAMGAAAVAEAAPGRFILGIGAGSSVTVERWNGLKYDRPLKKVGEVAQAVRMALDGDQMNFQGETINVSGFRLGRRPSYRVPIYIAALREKMIRQAVRLSDGVIINWLSPQDVKQVVAVVRDEAAKLGKDGVNFPVICRINLAVTEDVETARTMFRRAVTAYLNVPVYRAFHGWLGRGDDMKKMNELWDSGDRKGALEAVPEHVVDSLAGLGPAEHCYERVVEYVEAGVTVPAINFMLLSKDPAERAEEGMRNMRALAPK